MWSPTARNVNGSHSRAPVTRLTWGMSLTVPTGGDGTSTLGAKALDPAPGPAIRPIFWSSFFEMPIWTSPSWRVAAWAPGTANAAPPTASSAAMAARRLRLLNSCLLVSQSAAHRWPRAAYPSEESRPNRTVVVIRVARLAEGGLWYDPDSSRCGIV